jgi:hypothetical protein
MCASITPSEPIKLHPYQHKHNSNVHINQLIENKDLYIKLKAINEITEEFYGLSDNYKKQFILRFLSMYGYSTLWLQLNLPYLILLFRLFPSKLQKSDANGASFAFAATRTSGFSH